MLALARKINQSIMIGSDIEITLLEIKGDQVKIGINAPKSVPIYRKEIYMQIQDENKKASEGEIDVEVLNKLFSSKTKIRRGIADIKDKEVYDIFDLGLISRAKTHICCKFFAFMADQIEKTKRNKNVTVYVNGIGTKISNQ